MFAADVRRALLHGSAALVLLGGALSAQAAIIRPTNFGIGADAEVRDWTPTANFGFASELAVRIIDVDTLPTGATNDRNDLMYIKIDLAGLTAGNVPGAIFRLSYFKDNQLTQGRVVTSTGMQTGLVVYGLNPSEPGNNWAEGTITYDTAPGLANDNQPGNKDFDLTKLTPLGNILFPTIIPQNWFPAGGPMDLSGPALESFLNAAISAGAPSVTFIAGLLHDGNPAVSGTAITNRTYLFAHKGTTIINDPSYDSDTVNPSNPLGSPWHGQSNATGDFSPRLVLQEAVVPEPTSVAIAIAALVACATCRSRLSVA